MVSRTMGFLMERKSKKLERQIVVFESDDWGSIRMPSSEVYQRLRREKVSIGSPNSYDRFDTLASNEDLEHLIEVLSSVKDKRGNPAKMTMNYIMANPDFEKIKDSEFSQFYYETFIKTLQNYPHHDKSYELLKYGIATKVFQPQFHGREHLNVQKWLSHLRDGNTHVIRGFDNKMFSIKVNGDRVLPAFGIDSESEQSFVVDSIKEGLKMFETVFGFKSKSLIAPCYTWDDYVEDVAFSEGVCYLQGGYQQTHSKFSGIGPSFHYLGETNKNDQIYLTRNCSFEPSQIKAYNGSRCLKQITKQLKAGRPAIVSCHRLNFIGDLCLENRLENLRDFESMLKRLLVEFPDVEFMSSDELGDLLWKQSMSTDY